MNILTMDDPHSDDNLYPQQHYNPTTFSEFGAITSEFSTKNPYITYFMAHRYTHDPDPVVTYGTNIFDSSLKPGFAEVLIKRYLILENLPFCIACIFKIPKI